MEIERKRHRLLENAGAGPSFSSSYHSCNQHRKISIGVTVQEALAGIGSVTKMKDGTGASHAENISGERTTQENSGKLSFKIGQAETKIQKSGAWVSRAFHKKRKSIEFYANRSSFFQSENGMSKRVGCVTYSRKSKNNVGPDKLEEYAFAATQEMCVTNKREINNKIVVEKDGQLQTNQCSESLRMKLWDILQSAPSQAEDNKSVKIPKTDQNSDTIETDSEKPILNSCRPVTCSILERNSTNKFLSKQQKLKIGHLPPCVQQKIPEKGVFRFTGEEGQMCASGMNRNSSSFKRKSKRKHSLIAPRRIQYSPEPILEGKPEENPKHENLQSPLLPPHEATKAESLRSPLLVTSGDGVVLSFPMETKEKEKAQTVVPKMLPRQSISDKVVEGTPFHQCDVNVVQNSPVPNNADVEEESTHRSCKGVVKEKPEINATKENRFLSSQRSPNHRSDVVENFPLPNDGAVEESGFCQSWKRDAKKFQTDATENEKFQSPQKSTIHKYVGVLDNLPILKDRDVEEGCCNKSWKCDLNKEKPQIGTTKENRFHIEQGSPMHGTDVEFENSPVPNDAAVEEGSLCRYEVDKENLQTEVSKGKSSHIPPLRAVNLCLDSPELPQHMTISRGFFHHRRHSHACVASSDDTTEDRENFSGTSPIFQKKDVAENSSPSSIEKQSDEPLEHHMTKGEKWTPKCQQKPLFLLHRSTRVHREKIARAPSPVLPSMKGEENSQLDIGSQQSEDALARAIAQFASGLEKFKIRMKSHTQRKTSEILSVTIDKIQAQLQSVDSQIHTELNKLISLSNSKRRRLETRFQGQQERLQTIQAKFKEEVNIHLQECKNLLGEIEADQLELRAISERQKASHRKLLSQVEEGIQAQLDDAEKRIGTLHKATRKRMQELNRALSGAF
ncbi:meiosis-specific protein ASY3 isoform X2 [Nymphaea colorata]|nr:meiosis-specific protein ASY3 isoform X2 [Nymphaea colorata]